MYEWMHKPSWSIIEKSVLFPLRNSLFEIKINHYRNNETVANPSVVEFLQNIDFQRWCDAFSGMSLYVSYKDIPVEIDSFLEMF